MKRRGLFLVTVCSLVLTGLFMARAGWFSAGHAARSGARAAPTRTFDPMTSQAAWRYRHGQAANWRSVYFYRQ